MKLKRIMLITLVLLAILTIGAVSAIDDTDFNETLTADNVDEVSVDASVDDVDEVSVDASVDDEVISESDDDFVASSDEKMISEDNDESLTFSDNDVISNWTTDSDNVTENSRVMVSDIYEGENAIIVYNGPDGAVTITVDGIIYIIGIVDHVGCLLIPDLPAGEYMVVAGSSTATFKVLPRENSTGNGSGIIVNNGDLNFIDMYLCLNQEINTLSGFEGVNVMSVTISGNVDSNAVMTITSGDYTFTKDLTQEFDYKEFNEDLNGTQYGISFGNVEFFNALEHESSITFEFRYNDEILASEVCTISRNGDIIRLFRGDPSDDPENYVNVDGLFVFIMGLNLEEPYSVIKISEWPEGTADDIIITLQKEGDEAIVTSWNLNDVDRDSVDYAMWNIEQLQIQEEGRYLITLSLTVDGIDKVIEAGYVNIGSEGEENTFELWIDDDPQGFDVSSQDLSGYFIGSLTVPENMDGNISIITENDEFLFNHALNDFDPSLIRDNNIYDLSLSDNGRYIFEGVDDGTVFKFAFLDDEGSQIWGSSNYKLVIEDNTIWLNELNDDEGDDADDGVVIWVDEGDVKEFDLNNADDLDSAFAYVSVSNDLNGTIVLYCYNAEDDEEQDFFHIDLADVSNKYADEERDGFTIYMLSFNSLGDQFDILKDVNWFKLAFVTNYGDDESGEVDCREYNIEYDDENNVIKFWQTNGGNDEPSEDIALNFEKNEDESMSFEMGDDVTIAYLLIPDTEEFEDTIVNLKIYKNGEVVQTIESSDIERVLLGSRGAYQYAINIDLTQFEDKDVIGIWADCFNEDDYWEYAVQIDGNNVTFHEYSGPGKEYYIFYGNITIGDLNDAGLMGEHPNGRFVSWGISDVFNITEGTIVISDGETTIAEYSLDDCNVTYSYNILGNVYYLSLDDNNLYDILPENRNVIFTFSYVNESLTFKRIRIGDYVQKVITPDDFLWEEWSNYKFEVAEGSDSDKILTQDDDVIVIYGNSNMQSIYIDFGGGYFSIYVNDIKVENLGYVLHDAWVNSYYYNEDDDYLEDWIPELFLSRLRGGSVSLDEFHIKLADLGITESGTYNIKIIHTPTFDDDPEHYIYDSETELVNKNITYDPDCTDVLILNESRYKYGVPFLITFQFGENVLSESNRILIYINDELAFNHTILSYEENDYGEMELVNLWKVTPGEFNQELLNEYEFLDTGVYDAVVYLVKGDDAPVEIGSGSFTVVKQKGDMNFTLDSSAEDDGVHAIVYADIPEGDWDDYSLEIVIGDSEKIVPDFEETNDWFSRWYNEYVIFKDNTIYSKESLENIIGKGPVAIDLGVLDEGTHIFVSFGHGEETVYGDWDFYQNDFTVRASIVPADSNLKVTVENITVDATAVVNIEMDESFNGEVLVIVDGVVSYTVTVTNGKASLNISYLSAGVHNVTAKFEGNENYNPVENTTSFTVSKLTPVIVIAAGEAVEGGDLDVAVELDSDATGSVDVNGDVIALVDGKASATIKNLEAGEFDIVVVYSGDAKYVNASESKKITVKAKEDADLVVSVDNIAFGDVAVVSIEINANVTGKVTINGNEVAIINGKGSYNLSALDAGVHNVTVVFEGDKYFNACEKIATFTVTAKIVPVNPELAIAPVSDIEEGSDVVITISALGNFTGAVSVLIGDSEVGVVNVNDGSATFTIGAGNFTVGLNTVKITSAASENFTAGENSTTFTVTAKVLPKTITKDTLSNYFDENGVYVADLDEIIFVGEFKDIPKITINKAVNITGQNAVFTNTLFNINSDNVAVKDLTINTALTDYAITITGSNQVSLINNNINAINCILISDSTNFTVEFNAIISTAGVNVNGIYINGTGSGIVRNNNLNLKSAKTAYAINTNPTGPLKVSYINNTIYAESYFAVGIYDDAEEIRDNKITLSGNYAIGIAVLSENTVVDNNGITLSTTNTGSEVIDEPLGVETAGIKVNNSATITNNDVDSTGKSVSVVGGSSTISDNILNGQVSLESDGNTISGNVITTAEESAIDASSSTGNTISSNEAYSSTGNGDNAIKAAEGNTVKDNFEKFDPALTISVADITEGANAVITVKTNNTFSGNVSVKIATDNYTVEVIKGTGSLPVSGLAVGTYTATATLKATDVFTESVKNTTFTVKAKVATAITAPAVTTTYATSKNIVVSLKDASGNVLAGKSVTVVFNGATKTLTTDDKGQVSLAIGTSLVPKTYDATFTFAGDDTYAKSSGSLKVTVKKTTPKLTAKKKTFKVKKAKKYTVTLKTDKGKALNNVKVTLKVKGKKYTATVKKGKATFNLKKLTKKGNYKATVTFSGNKYYNKAVVKNVKITVKK